MHAAPRTAGKVPQHPGVGRAEQGVTAFGGGRFTLGALVTFVVTVADIAILNVGAAFWGLVAGCLVSWLLERPDFGTLGKA